MTRQAACACGKLSLICEGEPVRISVCHCLECQRRTGSIFGAQAWFPRDRVTKSTKGAARFVRVADSGKNIVFHFCPDCGSTLFWEPAGLTGGPCGRGRGFCRPEFSSAKSFRLGASAACLGVRA